MATKRKRKERRKKLKGLGRVILAGLVLGLASIAVIADRLLCSFWVTKDLPGIAEVSKFKHEREAIAKRFAFYILMAALYLIGWLAWNYWHLIKRFIYPF